MATEKEAKVVYAAGLVQGIVLVTFPAASTIFTDPGEYDLSNTQYGTMFLPQVLTAITASLLGGGLARRFGSKRVYLVGLLANLVSMALLIVSQFVAGDPIAYGLLLAATACLGMGFGLTAPTLNILTAVFHPTRVDTSVLTLNALLGLGTALAPVFVAIFVGLGFWWGLPLLSAVLLTGLLVVSSRLPLRSGARDAGERAGAGAGIPTRFWLFAAFAVLYGICETMNGNWAQLEMTGQLGASVTLASLALTTFWAMVTAGRVLFARIEKWLPTRNTYRLLPFVLAAALVAISLLPDDTPALGILAFGLAGLGCSALLPLTISFGQAQLVGWASVAGGVIAFYQLGYGIAAFGAGPLQDAGVGLPALYGFTAVAAVVMGGLSFVLAPRQPAPSSTRVPESWLISTQSSDAAPVIPRDARLARLVIEEEGGPVSTTAAVQEPIRSTVPARLDRLGWSKFHTRMVCGLGAAWILDGLQITIASSVTGVLQSPDTLGMTSTEIGLIASVYLVGQIIGALVFGKMSDQLGRRRLLIVTLLLYLFGTGAAAFVTGHHTGWLVFFYATRLVAGMGIGGQYAAINSAIDEMMPSKYRGRVDIWINGSYWAGAILGSFAALVFLNAFAVNVGWRLAFLMGPVLALVVVVVARTLPESPRWLLTHGRVEEAERELAKIEEVARRAGQELAPVDDSAAITLVPEKKYGYLTFARLVFRQYPKRAILGATLMITQSFLYNAIFFTYALVLTTFYGVSATKVPLYGLAFSVGNLLGPLILAPLFDSIGRKKMISGTYLISGTLLAVSAFLFDNGDLTANSQTFVWVVIFFFASAGASAAYLTVSETWPIEIRSEAIAVFFTIGTIFGAMGPAFYGALIGNGSSRTGLFIGYLVGAGIMIIGGIVELLIGINAEGKSLEAVTKPLTAADD